MPFQQTAVLRPGQHQPGGLEPSARIISVMAPELRPGQQAVRDSPARFRVLACGRRWGKGFLSMALCTEAALRPNARVWWVAPSFSQSEPAWRDLKLLTRQIPGTVKREEQQEIQFPLGGSLRVRSADRPEHLRGEGLDLLVLDEAASIVEAIWTDVLRPTLSDRGGRALFPSTPKGCNWFHRIYQWGTEGLHGFQSWNFESADNPKVTAEEIAAARRELPERVFAQEYLAHFISDATGVFRHVLARSILAPEPSRTPGHTYVVGVDWGKLNDFTAIAVLDVTAGRQVWLERSNHLDYHFQVGLLRLLAARYKPAAIIAERNAMGEPIIESLQRARLPVVPWTATNATKAAVIEGLALALEEGKLALLDHPAQKSELLAYGSERLPSGLIRYSAPDGGHDDTVIALALAAIGARAPRRSRLLDFELVS